MKAKGDFYAMPILTYDSSWDRGNEEIFNKKYREWKKRDWMKWLKDNLSFPFKAKRMEDNDDAHFTDVAKYESFRLGHTMDVLELSSEDDLYGIIVKVREKRRVGAVPLCDLSVTSKGDRNFWPVREYVVWFANR